MKAEEIAAQALALPNDARARLADLLVESLDPAEDGWLRQLWAAEAQQRLRDLRSGTVQSIPGDEATASLRKKYGG